MDLNSGSTAIFVPVVPVNSFAVNKVVLWWKPRLRILYSHLPTQLLMFRYPVIAHKFAHQFADPMGKLITPIAWPSKYVHSKTISLKKWDKLQFFIELYRCAGLSDADISSGDCGDKDVCEGVYCGNGRHCIPSRRVCLIPFSRRCPQFQCGKFSWNWVFIVSMSIILNLVS